MGDDGSWGMMAHLVGDDGFPEEYHFIVTHLQG